MAIHKRDFIKVKEYLLLKEFWYIKSGRRYDDISIKVDNNIIYNPFINNVGIRLSYKEACKLYTEEVIDDFISSIFDAMKKDKFLVFKTLKDKVITKEAYDSLAKMIAHIKLLKSSKLYTDGHCQIEVYNVADNGTLTYIETNFIKGVATYEIN